MKLLLIGLLWVLVEFGLYAIWLRHWPQLRTERGIFQLHLFSVFALALVTAVCLSSGVVAQSWEAFAAVISLHGIYSVSFLEVWSLAQGGYSLIILEKVASGADLGAPWLRRELEEIGDVKRHERLTALRSLRLIGGDREKVRLTTLGLLCHAALRTITVLANLRSVG